MRAFDTFKCVNLDVYKMLYFIKCKNVISYMIFGIFYRPFIGSTPNVMGLETCCKES
jgi:hypothetical protein